MIQSIEPFVVEKAESSKTKGRWSGFGSRLRGGIDDALQMLADPKVSISLMRGAAEHNDPFYQKLVETFYRDARRRHPKLPVIGRRTHGIAICALPRTFDEYFMKIDAAARRNFKKS